jgi:hypothetical protein
LQLHVVQMCHDGMLVPRGQALDSRHASHILSRMHCGSQARKRCPSCGYGPVQA